MKTKSEILLRHDFNFLLDVSCNLWSLDDIDSVQKIITGANGFTTDELSSALRLATQEGTESISIHKSIVSLSQISNSLTKI